MLRFQRLPKLLLLLRLRCEVFFLACRFFSFRVCCTCDAFFVRKVGGLDFNCKYFGGYVIYRVVFG